MSSSSPPDTGGTGDSEVRRRKTRSQAKAEGREEPKPENETGAENQEVETVPQTPTQEVTTQSEQGRAPPEQQYLQPQPIYQEVLVVPPNRIIFAIPKWIVYTLTVVFGILFIALGGYVGDVVYKKYFYAVPTMPNMTFSAVGNEGWEFFKKFDRDDDLRLSLDEYETLYHALVSSGINVTTDLVDKNHYTIGKNEKTITVQAYFQPLLLETMNSDLNDTSENFDSLKGLQSWKKVNTEQMDLGVKQFYGFLPPNQTFLDKLGEVYVIYGQNSTSLPDIPSHRSSNKYIPPRVEDEIVVIHQLLTMFHPRPFLRTRFPPQGATACVRAVNDEYIDISFRIHAEFQLSDPPYNPMWFTPGQFTGNFIITRDYSKIVYFHMYVPTDKKLNVDMEWMTDIQMAASMQVDIGFMPQMEVKTIDKPSSNEIKEPSMKWKKEITEVEARRKLEIKMYPFKQVPYYNFTDSFEIAQKENKLVHSILLWGALDDQSC